MESLALGRPVVSTYVAGIPELVESGICGWLVPAGDAGALAHAMAAVLSATPEHLDCLGAAGRQRVEERHNATREAARLAAIFRRTITEIDTHTAADSIPLPLAGANSVSN
jgi:glycosyltransferase involved in cell wall biosynthesis